MKSLSGPLTAHQQQSETTLATCWKITLRDETVLGFTDNTTDLPVDGLVYIAALGYNASAVQTTAGSEVDNLELIGVLDPSAFDAADIAAGRWDFAAFEIFRVNYLDVSMGTEPMRKGTLGEVRHGKRQFNADLMGMSQRLTQKIGRIYSPSCPYDLGDADCKVDLPTFPSGIVGPAAVTSFSSRRVFAHDTLAAPTGYFDGGLVRFSTGQNAGISREVKTYTDTAPGGTFEMQEAFPYPIALTDSFYATVGCLKRYTEDCIQKFVNGENFGGFPHLPGLDRMVSGT